MEKNVRLGDVCKLKQGFQVPLDKQTNSKMDGYVRFIRIVDYTQNTEDIRFVEDNSKFYYVEEDDVVMIRYGAAGEVGRGINGVIANNMFLIEPQNNIDKNYLYWFLKWKKTKQTLLSHSSSTTMPAINFKTVNDLNLRLYDISRQKNIVQRLDEIQNIINLRKQQLKQLDELVKARFVEMFGEWECNPEPLKSFLVDITYGFTNPMPDADEGPWKITAKDVINGKVNYDTARKTTVHAFEELTAKSKPAIGDVLLTKDGTLGRCAVVEEDGICVNQSVAVLKCNEKILPKFLATLLQLPEYQREMLKNAGGGTIKHIYITKVVNMLITVPTIVQQVEFLAFVEQVNKSKVAVQKALDEAQTLFDSLMQEYFG